MAADRRTAANQANAKKSTGPRTQQGKRRAAQNAVRHGLGRKGQDPARMAEVAALAEAFCRDEPGLSVSTALLIAEAILRLEDVSAAAEQLTQLACEKLDKNFGFELREDLARLHVLERLSSIADYERRAFGALRRALRMA